MVNCEFYFKKKEWDFYNKCIHILFKLQYKFLSLAKTSLGIYQLCFYVGKITLRDLKRCRMAHIFYDTFFNLEKYLDHEQRDPFAVQKVPVQSQLLFDGCNIKGCVLQIKMVSVCRNMIFKEVTFKTFHHILKRENKAPRTHLSRQLIKFR